MTQVATRPFQQSAAASGSVTARSDLVSTSRSKRVVFLVAGLAAALIAALGVFLPLIPTTFPLIVASFCLVRSSPVLERKLLRNRLFGPYMKYVDGNEPMPRKAKIISLVLMWSGVLIGAFFIARSDAPWWLLIVQGVLGVIATVVICRWGGKAQPTE